jgi:hypothetical protein
MGDGFEYLVSIDYAFVDGERATATYPISLDRQIEDHDLTDALLKAEEVTGGVIGISNVALIRRR